jgi:hypothetical protein
MKVDGSITGPNGEPLRGSWRNLELVSPILRGEDGIHQLQLAMDVLKGMVEVNKSCGIHVHHGALDLTTEQMVTIYKLWKIDQSAIDYLVTPSRRNNSYCLPLAMDLRSEGWRRATRSTPGYFTRIVGGVDGRAVLNFTSYGLRGTLEFRQHHSSLDYGKILAWVVFTQAVVEYGRARVGKRIVPSLGTFNPEKTNPARHLFWKLGMRRDGEDELVAKAYRRLRGSFDLFWKEDRNEAGRGPMSIYQRDAAILAAADGAESRRA